MLPSYSTTVAETIACTVPAVALSSGGVATIDGTPTLVVTTFGFDQQAAFDGRFGYGQPRHTDWGSPLGGTNTAALTGLSVAAFRGTLGVFDANLLEEGFARFGKYFGGLGFGAIGGHGLERAEGSTFISAVVRIFRTPVRHCAAGACGLQHCGERDDRLHGAGVCFRRLAARRWWRRRRSASSASGLPGVTAALTGV